MGCFHVPLSLKHQLGSNRVLMMSTEQLFCRLQTVHRSLFPSQDMIFGSCTTRPLEREGMPTKAWVFGSVEEVEPRALDAGGSRNRTLAIKSAVKADAMPKAPK